MGLAFTFLCRFASFFVTLGTYVGVLGMGDVAYVRVHWVRGMIVQCLWEFG